MADVFISYSRQDLPRARAVADALETQGWSVWWDRTIPADRDFDEVIEGALDACKCVVVLWSKTSVRRLWVRTEAAEGLERGILVPAVIEEARLPLAFRRIHAADLTFLSKRRPFDDVDEPSSAKDALWRFATSVQIAEDGLWRFATTFFLLKAAILNLPQGS